MKIDLSGLKSIMGGAKEAIGDFVSGAGKKLDEAATYFDERFGKTIDTVLMGWTNIDSCVSNYAKNVGASAAEMDAFRKNILKAADEGKTALRFNVSVEDLTQATASFQNELGRRVEIATEAYENTLAPIMNIFGGNGSGGTSEVLTNLLTNLEKFGVSYYESASYASRMYQTANKSGLSFSKYSKNVVDNMKLAQKYTFEGGIRGLETMVKKSMELGMNIDTASKVADKILGNGDSNVFENAAEMASKLQVLGGPFAQMGDAMSLLGMSLNDVGALQETLGSMTRGMFYINEKTGEIEASAADKQRMKAAAAATGMDYSELWNTGTRNKIRDRVSVELRGTNYTDDIKDLILNTAILKKNENGGIDSGVVVDGVFKKISELNKEDFEKIRQKQHVEKQTDSENIADIALATQSINEKISGIKEGIKARTSNYTERTGHGKFVKDFLSDEETRGAAVNLGAIGKTVQSFTKVPEAAIAMSAMESLKGKDIRSIDDIELPDFSDFSQSVFESIARAFDIGTNLVVDNNAHDLGGEIGGIGRATNSIKDKKVVTNLNTGDYVAGRPAFNKYPNIFIAANEENPAAFESAIYQYANTPLVSKVMENNGVAIEHTPVSAVHETYRSGEYTNSGPKQVDFNINFSGGFSLDVPGGSSTNTIDYSELIKTEGFRNWLNKQIGDYMNSLANSTPVGREDYTNRTFA